MNIAFPALLIFLLILPGFIFTLSYYEIDGVSFNFPSFSRKAMLAIVVTFILHSLWLLILFWLGYTINFGLIFMLISGVQSNSYLTIISSVSFAEVMGFSSYLLSVYVFAYFVGKTVRRCVKKFKLEKYPLFRLDSPWYYLFTGYDWEDGKPDAVDIAAVVEFAGVGYLYVGYLEKFFLDTQGNIDRLVLTSVEKKVIGFGAKEPRHNSSEDEFDSVDGDYFVLKYSEIKNLNVRFVRL